MAHLMLNGDPLMVWSLSSCVEKHPSLLSTAENLLIIKVTYCFSTSLLFFFFFLTEELRKYTYNEQFDHSTSGAIQFR